MIFSYRTFILPVASIFLLTYSVSGHVSRSLITDGLLVVPRTDLEGYGALPLVPQKFFDVTYIDLIPPNKPP